MTPTPPMPPGPEQEEARRQAEGQASPVLEGVAQAADAVLDGTVELVVDAATATAEGVVTVVKVSAEVVGGILTGLGDL